jgi:hypothetical protein
MSVCFMPRDGAIIFADLVAFEIRAPVRGGAGRSSNRAVTPAEQPAGRRSDRIPVPPRARAVL